MKIKIAIIEDEQAFVDSLGRLLRQWSETYKYLIDIKSYATGEAFLLAWEASEIFDVIFVDIMLPNSVNGMDLAKYIREKNPQVPIIFATSVRENMGDGYRVSAMQYLVKPAMYSDIEECMNKISVDLSRKKSSIYCFRKSKNSISRIQYHDILYFSSSLQYTEIHTIYGVEKQLERLKNIETSLPDEFIRCHRSIIVNIEAVHSISPVSITLPDFTTIPISKTYFNAVKNKYLAYFG